MTTHYAAIDGTDPVTGAVYGVGTTPGAAESQARIGERYGECGVYAIVECSARAAAYVDEHGGAPSRALTVSLRSGVRLREEDTATDLGPRTAAETYYERVISRECPRCRAPAGRACTDPRGRGETMCQPRPWRPSKVYPERTVEDANGQPVCDVRPSPIMRSTVALIAAVPDLAEALAWFVGSTDEPGSPAWNRAIARARVALEKAGC